MTGERHLLLVGAGHAHLHLVKNVSRLHGAGYRVSLVAPRWFDYSGAASGIATGRRSVEACRIDVAALTDGVLDHHQTTVRQVDLARRTVLTDLGRTLDWDLVSFNVGSVARVPAGVEVDDAAMRIKPLASLLQLRERLRTDPAARPRVTVVGAGASGLELAAHLAARPDVGQVLLLEAGDRVGPSLPAGASRRLLRLLRQRGADVRTGVGIRRVAADAVVLEDGTRLPHDIAVLATGLAAPPLATDPELGGPQGIPVRSTLQHRDHDDVYAAGDCADFLPHSLARIGVHGARQGPVLLAALEARAAGAEAPTYRPPARALAILDLGAGTALATRGRWWWLGRSSLVLKRLIDRRWISGYRS